MSGHSEDRIDELCAAVADGTPVDWDSEELRADTAEIIRELRAIERIAAPQRDPGSDAAPERGNPAQLAPEILGVFPNGSWGALQILGILGRGGSADVYLAFDPGLQHSVALKVPRERELTPAAENRLFDEAQRMARVRHANLVTVHGVARFDGRIGIWSDRIVGETLERIVLDRGPMSATEAAGVGIALCQALAALHRAGIIHGDVTTRNVMRERGGRIVLMDLGASSEIRGPEPVRAFGTLVAMPPERLRGERGDPRSDLYSLGVLLWRLLTGSYPHAERTADALIRAIESGPRPSLRDLRPELPIGLIQTIEKAVDSDPARRHASAGAFERTLDRARSRRSGSAR